ncbi:MAG: prepilin-type N-terminal cleavage/methylation domain-containing protein [Candidatus Omnitrophica bacterium]|nr:prepilin-type N-terminal cleavage/methylation domain-containing protein [Candidatus Omnitrophota bacterium]MDD5437291.1 prepilin-type N-terminal cleavage/methylation domain-containing protein [Candidatus Omnitrophota bacterium]
MYIFSRKGFTLIEIMIVVAIIAIALAIAIPNFVRISSISKRTVCINNLKKISAAVDQWAIDNNIRSGTNLTPEQESDVYNNYLRSGKPKCPSAGEYLLNPVGANPQVQCTDEQEGHKI